MGKEKKLRGKGKKATAGVLIGGVLAGGAGLFLIGEDESETCSRPAHSRTLDVRWLLENNNEKIAPYSCRRFEDVSQVDIEHIVAWEEAVRSGMPSCDGLAKAFVNDMENITVAFPDVNRNEKSDKDAAGWLPEYNRCYYASTVADVKDKYGMEMDEAEEIVIEGILAQCSEFDKINWSCETIY